MYVKKMRGYIIPANALNDLTKGASDFYSPPARKADGIKTGLRFWI